MRLWQGRFLRQEIKVAVTGSSGFLGKALSSVFHYKPLSRFPNKEDLEGFDCLIHLAGEPIFGLWTPAKKRAIYDSRVKSTQHLVSFVNRLTSPPRLLIVASAVGYYGDRGEEILTESSGPGEGFLSQVCQDWEQATRDVQAPTRVVNARFGIVIGKGAKILTPPLSLRFGSGNQWMSWIALADWVRAVRWVIDRDELRGPVNLVAPHPIRQRDWASLYGKAICRPTFPCPSFLLPKELFLYSQRAIPAQLERSGFTFFYSSVDKLLKDILPFR